MPGPSVYCLFDVTLASDFSLAELLPVSTDAPEFVCQWTPALELPASDAVQWIHDWTADGTEEGVVWLRVGRWADGYWLHFPDLADFLLSAEGTRISLRSGPETPPETLSHLLVDQVMPLVLAHHGRFVLHASAVVMQDGQGVAFAGSSGRGKSTLAAHFAGQGFPLLTDDGLLLDEHSGSLWLTPSYAGVRLWEDSWAALFGPQPELQPFAHYSPKKRIAVAAHGLVSVACAVPLSRLYFLAAPEEMEAAQTVEIAPLTPRAAFMELFAGSYRLDISDRARLRQTFGRYTELSVRPLFYRLAYPRNLAALPDVREAILDHLRTA